MRERDIAAVIERDLLRADDGLSVNTTKCFSCGFGFIYRGSRFCSDRCRKWFDDGNPPFDSSDSVSNVDLSKWRVIAGPPGTVGTNPWQPIIDARKDPRSIIRRRGIHGFYIICLGCNKEFESKGLRCCSTECERAYREQQENLAVMAEVSDTPREKRRCGNPECPNTIPIWRKGRRVSGKTQFCSPKCAKRAKRA